MHKGIILLVKADNKENALTNAEVFLKNYERSVRDWYQIGGRWTGLLSELSNKFEAKTQKYLDEQADGDRPPGTYTNKLITKYNTKIQDIWRRLGGRGNHPWMAGSTETFEDVILLKDCLELVKDYATDPIEQAQMFRDKMIKEKKSNKKHPKRPVDMSGYYAIQYGNTVQENFSVGVNVYNAEDYTAETIPEDMDNMRAVVVDMHH